MAAMTVTTLAQQWQQLQQRNKTIDNNGSTLPQFRTMVTL
jgi:hypothetical protein